MNRAKSSRVRIARNSAVTALAWLALLVALSGSFGSALQDMAFGWVLLLSVFAATLAIGWVLLGDWSSVLNSFDSERATHQHPEEDVVPASEDYLEELRSILDTNRRQEKDLLQRYANRSCSAEDVVRATALRIQAEIALIRHQGMPKTWAEACRDHDPNQVR